MSYNNEILFIDYGPYSKEAREIPNKSLRELTEFATKDYTVHIGIPTRHTDGASQINMYNDYSMTFENRTGRPIYIKHLNGIIQTIPPIRGTWKKSFIDVFESINCDHYFNVLKDENGYDTNDIYAMLREENKSRHFTAEHYQDGIATQRPSKRYYSICRRVEIDTISNSDKGVVMDGLPIMLFDEYDEAVAAKFYTEESDASGLNKEMDGIEIIVINPSTRYTSLFTPFMDGIRKIKVKRKPCRSEGKVIIRETRSDGHVTESTFTISELMEGEGVKGFRLYETEQEAYADSRKPFSQDQKTRLNVAEEEFKSYLNETREEHRRKRVKLEESLKDDLLKLRKDYSEQMELLKKNHLEDMEELHDERKRAEKLNKAERDKAREEERLNKAKDKTSIVGKAVDAVLGLVGLAAKIFSLAF